MCRCSAQALWLFAPCLSFVFGSVCARVMTTTSKGVLAGIALLVVAAVAGPMLAFPGTCPVCRGRTANIRTVTDETNAPSRNLCVWNRSVCANLLYGPDSVICTQCWQARSPHLDRWERASEIADSFQKPLGPVIRGFPLPPSDRLRSRVVFTQAYANARFTESVAFWCVDREGVLAGLRGYCATNALTFSAETNMIAGQIYVKIE